MWRQTRVRLLWHLPPAKLGTAARGQAATEAAAAAGAGPERQSLTLTMLKKARVASLQMQSWGSKMCLLLQSLLQLPGPAAAEVAAAAKASAQGSSSHPTAGSSTPVLPGAAALPAGAAAAQAGALIGAVHPAPVLLAS